MAHVSDHSNHHQVYTYFPFTGKSNYIDLPSRYLWDNKSSQKKFLLLFLALQSLVARQSLPQLPSVFSGLCLTYPFPYTCKSLLMLGCLLVSIWFQASEGFQDTYYLWGGIVRRTPKPQPGAEKK